jgi:2-phospho-L-lactate transferase/gluconeogenesis factor (CofD/UPF0052 family)
MSKNGLRVALFCGGRGSASIIRALCSRSDVRLSLIINGFDDGQSTGVMRRLIPVLLGPSDFRKNLSYVLNPQAPQQMALRHLIEQRLIGSRQLFGADGLLGFASHGDTARLSPHLSGPLSQLEVPCRERIREHLSRFFEYVAGNERALTCRDISLGNLLFAGIYLETRDFNTAIRRFGELCSTGAEILNVTDGACRWLVALKENGELLACESDIVGHQSPIPIASLYLLEQPVGPDEQLLLAPLSFRQKHTWLRERDMPLDVSTEAASAIAGADMIIYGPGTQHSSLLPSYRVAAAAIRRSQALLKVLVINLDMDHDIQGLSATDILDRALASMKDPFNENRVITHAIYNTAHDEHRGSIGIELEKLSGFSSYRGVSIIAENYRDPKQPTVHHGSRVVDQVFALLGHTVRSRDRARRMAPTDTFPIITR